MQSIHRLIQNSCFIIFCKILLRIDFPIVASYPKSCCKAEKQAKYTKNFDRHK